MGTQGLLGFITNGLHRGKFTPDNSEPPMLGSAIISEILKRVISNLRQYPVTIDMGISSRPSLVDHPATGYTHIVCFVCALSF